MFEETGAEPGDGYCLAHDFDWPCPFIHARAVIKDIRKEDAG